MTVKDLIEVLQKERPTKKVYFSGEDALVEIKTDNIILQTWGVIFR